MQEKKAKYTTMDIIYLTSLFVIASFLIILLFSGTGLSNNTQTQENKIIKKQEPELYPEEKQNYYYDTYEVTAYCPCEKCCGIWAGIGSIKDGTRKTASGHIITENDKFCAADTSILPFKTKIDIPGYGICNVEDRGGAIKKKKLDLYFPTHQEALNWGRRTIGIKIYK